MRTTFQRRVLAVIFVVYLSVVAALTVLPTHFSRSRAHSDRVNLVPFSYSYRCVKWVYLPHTNLRAFCLVNTLGNIALFLPLGILLPLSFDRYRSLKRVVAVAFFLSLSIESIQFISLFIGSPRTVDIDDVLLNTLGAVFGFILYRVVKSIGEMGRGIGEGGSEVAN